MVSYSKTELQNEALSKSDLIEQLHNLGVEEGMTLEVHSSLKSLGYVIGGGQAVVDALMDAVSYSGTLVMTIQSSENSEPAYWSRPPVDRKLWKKIRDNTPAFNPDSSEYRNMGEVAENLNRRPGAYRSSHPAQAFVTYGKYAKLIAHNQSLNFGLGEQSPLATLYELPSYILLIGVDYDKATGMHLGEIRSNVRPIILQGGAIEENGYRKWVQYLDYDMDSQEFIEIGKAMEKSGLVKQGKVGKADCRLMKFAEVVDFTCEYLKKKYPY